MAPFFMPGVLIGSRSLKLTGGAYNRADELFIFIELLHSVHREALRAGIILSSNYLRARDPEQLIEL